MSFGFSRAILVAVVSGFVDCCICKGGEGTGRCRTAAPRGAAVAAAWLSLGILEDVDSMLISTAAAVAADGAAAVGTTASTALRVGAMAMVPDREGWGGDYRTKAPFFLDAPS